MPDLSKRESAYFVGFALAALAILITTLVLWSQTQNDCWSRYKTEQAAVEACEQ